MLRAVRNTTLLGRAGQWDLEIGEDGRVTGMTPSVAEQSAAVLAADAAVLEDSPQPSELDAGGRVCLPGFVDAHIHLDKALISSRCNCTTGDFSEALRETLEAKRSFTEEDIFQRAQALLEEEIAFGTTLMRAHAEVDHIVGLASARALLRLRDEYAERITIQVAAFAQEGITNIEGEMELLREAMKLGCDVVGSAPYVDPSGTENIRLVFDLAAEFGCPVDFHLDYHLGEEKPSLLEDVLRETNQRGWQGRVCLGHMTALSSLPPDQLAEVATNLQKAGVSVLALPASDIYMMARGDTHDRRRGVCPVHLLKRKGLCAAFATNNVQNLFTQTGDGDVLKVCTLLSQLLQLGTPADYCECLEMATSGAARCIGVEHSLEVGAWADLVVLDSATASQAVAAPPVARTVLKRGRLVAQTCRVVKRFQKPGQEHFVAGKLVSQP